LCGHQHGDQDKDYKPRGRVFRGDKASKLKQGEEVKVETVVSEGNQGRGGGVQNENLI